ncbi:Alpha/Beta hydrolase protein [Cubamyces menziesii]|nr:Alpha/Beta hydrolase protein [Cubamyces menziesii]
MEALPLDSRIRQVYPDNLFLNGMHPTVRSRRVKVVLIHGISTPGITWKEIAPYLAEKGLRVLVYDLYGKGYSEAPHVVYNTTLFVVQLALLLQYIHWDSAHIVGFSMGGGVAAAFASSMPHLLTGKVAFVASAGLLERANAPNPLKDLQATELPGYKRSLQSCFENGPIRGLEAAYDEVARVTVGPAQQPLQVRIIHGTEDEIVPFGEAIKIQARVPQAEIVKIENAAHDLVLRDGHWQIVAKRLLEFLQT